MHLVSSATPSKIGTVFFLSSLLLLAPVAAFSTTKFVEWFPQSLGKLRGAWTGPYKSLFDNFVQRGQSQCGPVLDRLLEYGTSELRKTTIASAQVTLGLIPSLLGCTGNSVPEVSLLASQRPLLTLVLTVGAPGMWPSRVTDYTSPLKVLDSVPSTVALGGIRAMPVRRTGIVLSSYL